MNDLPQPDANDVRLERALRDVLADRDPGAAPYALRDRVDRVPERASRGSTRARVAAGVIGTLVVAAAAVIVVLALGNRGALDATGVGASPGPGNLPRALGPGIVDYPDIAQTNQVAAFVALGCLAVAAVLALRRRRRASLVALAVMFAIPVAATALSLLPAAVADESDGAYVAGIQQADMPAGYQGFQLEYVAGEPFATGFSIVNAGPLPIRVHGIIGEPEDRVSNAHWTGVVVIDDPAQQQTAAGRPFEPLTLAPGASVFVRLAGVPGPCGAVLADPAAPPPAGVDFLPLDMWLSYDVLGWPRTTRLETSFQITAPTLTDCIPSS